MEGSDQTAHREIPQTDGQKDLKPGSEARGKEKDVGGVSTDGLWSLGGREGRPLT